MRDTRAEPPARDLTGLDLVGIPVEDRQWLSRLTNDFLAAADPGAGLSPEQQIAFVDGRDPKRLLA